MRSQNLHKHLFPRRNQWPKFWLEKKITNERTKRKKRGTTDDVKCCSSLNEKKKKSVTRLCVRVSTIYFKKRPRSDFSFRPTTELSPVVRVLNVPFFFLLLLLHWQRTSEKRGRDSKKKKKGGGLAALRY